MGNKQYELTGEQQRLFSTNLNLITQREAFIQHNTMGVLPRHAEKQWGLGEVRPKFAIPLLFVQIFNLCGTGKGHTQLSLKFSRFMKYLG